MLIQWDGKSLGLEQKGEHKLVIPGLADFKVMSVQVQNDGEQYISVYFSDPLLASQDLNGLIAFAPEKNSKGQKYWNSCAQR